MRAVVAGVVASVVVATAIVGPSGIISTSRAQPAQQGDLARAKELYKAAETAMTDNRFMDAARDYGAAYDITKDPVLFYKIGSANERAGKCDVALIYFRRYLREAKPSDTFIALTRERITVCGGDPKDAGSGSAVDPVGAGSGSVVSGSADPGAGSAAVPDPGLGSAVPPPPSTAQPGKHRLAWILVGGSIASLTVGAVLGYSANAAESDVNDLYVGLNGTPPVFNSSTQKRFDDLVAEGERYQTLSWVAFGIAGGLAIGAAIKFATAKDDEVDTKQSVRVTPTVSPRGAGVSAVIRF